MRKILLSLVAISVLVSMQTIAAQDRLSPLDAPTALRLPATLPPCGITTVLLTLARTSRVAIGFEEETACRGQFPRLSVTYDKAGDVSVREALDRLMALSAKYQWSEMNGVAVVRPVASWADPADALNLEVGPFHSDNATVSGTLARILQSPHNFTSHLDHPAFSMAFNGGTMVEALNALVRAREGVGWYAGLIVHPTPSNEDRSPTLTVGIRTFNVGDRGEGEGAFQMGRVLPISPARR